MWGALLTAAGSTYGAYGADRKKNAMRHNQRAYQAALAKYLEQKQGNQAQAMGQANQFADDNLSGISDAVHGTMATPAVAPINRAPIDEAAHQGPDVYANYANGDSGAAAQFQGAEQQHSADRANSLTNMLAQNRGRVESHRMGNHILDQFHVQQGQRGTAFNNMLANGQLRDQFMNNDWQNTAAGYDQAGDNATHAGDDQMFWGQMLNLGGQYAAGRYAASRTPQAQPNMQWA